jgi:hypothetical protein
MSSIIALAGPQNLVDLVLRKNKEQGISYDKIVKFYIPGDHGMFPDTQGDIVEDFDKIVLTCEDPQLIQYMRKCVDAILDFQVKKQDILDKLGYQDIIVETFGSRRGEYVFCLVGTVKWKPMDQQSLRGIKVAHG